jgi:hypothetical protein
LFSVEWSHIQFITRVLRDRWQFTCNVEAIFYKAKAVAYVVSSFQVVFEDLVKAREGFVLASDLHLLYEVTPTYVDLEPDWTAYYQHFVELSPIDQAVANRVGVVEPFLLRMAHGVPIMEQRSGGRLRNGRGSSRGRISPAIQKSKWCSPSGPQLTTDQMLRVCKRFYVALMLSKLVQVTKARTPSTHRFLFPTICTVSLHYD